MTIVPKQGPLTTLYGGVIEGEPDELINTRFKLKNSGINCFLEKSQETGRQQLIINVLPKNMLEAYNQLHDTDLAVTREWKEAGTFVTRYSANGFIDLLTEMTSLLSGKLKGEAIALRKDLIALKRGDTLNISHSRITDFTSKTTENHQGFQVKAVAEGLLKEIPSTEIKMS